MCVQIMKNNKLEHFCCDTPIEMQILGSSEVIVEYYPEDKEVGKFLQEIEKCSKKGISLHMNVKVNYNGYLDGFKIKKKISKVQRDINVNEVIKLMVLAHSEADKRLEELVSLCVR